MVPTGIDTKIHADMVNARSVASVGVKEDEVPRVKGPQSGCLDTYACNYGYTRRMLSNLK
jgi:hypothetical protein